jgi:uncharacterized protein YukE
VEPGGSGGDLAGGGFQVSRQAVYQAAEELSQIAGLVRALAEEVTSASSAAASACPGWDTGAASSAAGSRWHQEVTTRANAVAAAGDKLNASAARYEMVETTLAQQMSVTLGLPGQ